jgi:putative flippase GtrA
MISKIFDKKELLHQFVKFFFFSGFATMLDFTSFYLLIQTQLHYQLCVVISFSIGAVAHFSMNKIYTFKNQSNQIASQFLTFLMISFVYLILSMVLMHLFVEIFGIWEMYSRVMTTFVLFFYSFVSHKYITFNKRYFNKG